LYVLPGLLGIVGLFIPARRAKAEDQQADKRKGKNF
jgi:hypothetical protein